MFPGLRKYEFSRKQIIGLLASLVLIGLFLYFNWVVWGDGNVQNEHLAFGHEIPVTSDEPGEPILPKWMTAVWEIIRSAFFRVAEVMARG